MTASGLTRLPITAGADVVLPRVAAAGRLVVGAAMAVGVVVLTVMSGKAATFDIAPVLVLSVVVGTSVGGRWGGFAAAAVVTVASFNYYSEPAWVGTPGNAVRVLLLVGAAGLTVGTVGPLRQAVDHLRARAGNRRGMAERVQSFGANLGEVPDYAVLDAIVAEARRLVEAEVVVLTVRDSNSGRHVVRAVAGTPPSAVGLEVLPGVGIAGQAIRERSLVMSGPRNANTGQTVVSVPAIQGGRVAATLTVRRADGDAGFTDIDRQALELIAPTVALTVNNWVLRQQLREASIRDPLSGLYSRSYLDAALEQLLALRRRTPAAERKPLSLILFDLDEFRTFNEQHGREAGDAVVRAIGALLRERFRASDLLARVGNDAFLVVLDGADLDVTERAASEIRAQVHTLALTDERGHRVAPSISAGCASFRDDAERSDAIIRSVQAALDTARWSGPGAIVSI